MLYINGKGCAGIIQIVLLKGQVQLRKGKTMRVKKHMAIFAALGLMMAIAVPATAQKQQEVEGHNTASSQDDQGISSEAEPNEIIVQGYTKKQVREFLWRSIIETGGRVAKRENPLCVGIDNAPSVLAEPILARIHANLRSFSIPIAEKDCRPNSIIVFHRDAHSFVNWLDDNESRVFAALYLPEKRRLIRPVRAAYSWHFIPSEAEDFEFEDAFFVVNGELRGSSPNTPGGRILPLPPAASTHTFAVVDLDAIDGLTIEQVADYLTMQMLLELQPGSRDEVPADSILNLFGNGKANPDAAPEMSRLDRAVLTEIYASGRSDFRAGFVRNTIARTSIEALDREGLIVTSDEE